MVHTVTASAASNLTAPQRPSIARRILPAALWALVGLFVAIAALPVVLVFVATAVSLPLALGLVGVVLSQGQIAGLLRHGLSEDAIGITALRHAAQAALGDRSVPWYWSYKVRLAVR